MKKLIKIYYDNINNQLQQKKNNKLQTFTQYKYQNVHLSFSPSNYLF